MAAAVAGRRVGRGGDVGAGPVPARTPATAFLIAVSRRDGAGHGVRHCCVAAGWGRPRRSSLMCRGGMALAGQRAGTGPAPTTAEVLPYIGSTQFCVGDTAVCRGRPIPEQARLPVAFVPARTPVRAFLRGRHPLWNWPCRASGLARGLPLHTAEAPTRNCVEPI